ncbi:MAG: hypothetical protein MK098_13045 [Marinovum sp.]|nr:hypothetical protein [Marinovum sp.]
MLVIGGALVGAGLGVYRARNLGGSMADQVQYAAGYGLAFTMLGIVATFAIHRIIA